MKQNTSIISKVIIENNAVFFNDLLIFRDEPSVEFTDFIKKAYKFLKIEYPKFFKMDNLSKLAFTGADIILRDITRDKEENNVALVLANRSSSADTDIKYQKSIENKSDYYPSPAVFVYTLPNICLGEISIKHKLYSENTFFIFDRYNEDYMANYSAYLIQSGKAEKVLCGWVEFLKGNYRLAFYLYI
ncbi:hypothetical protein [Polluticaenibacter yanchengensis]|uniref:3-oxoacyl-ACP synthase n=1 Tax=Polluticaenibacter yanchengensis TaxID=3014562 RepID=A0ABT4UP69_9BACT|nr:hypothetical protein [Chitinophagaceae bacterium LY-5]